MKNQTSLIGAYIDNELSKSSIKRGYIHKKVIYLQNVHKMFKISSYNITRSVREWII